MAGRLLTWHTLRLLMLEWQRLRAVLGALVVLEGAHIGARVLRVTERTSRSGGIRRVRKNGMAVIRLDGGMRERKRVWMAGHLLNATRGGGENIKCLVAVAA